MPQMVKIRSHVFHTKGNGNPYIRLAAGSLHEQSEDTLREVALCNADLVDAEAAPTEPAAAQPLPQAQPEPAAEAPAVESAATSAKSKRGG